MDLIQKKQKMCNILLNSPHDYDLIIYKLLKTDILDEIILKLDNKIVCCNANPSEIYSAEEQFLMLLTRLFDFLLKIFPSLYKAREVVMEDIINGNKQNVEKYLLSKHYVGDNKYINFFKENNYKIICSIINAKNDNCYFALYEKNKDNTLQTLIEPEAENIDTILSILNSYNLDTLNNQVISFVGDGSKVYKDKILEVFPNSIIADDKNDILFA